MFSSSCYLIYFRIVTLLHAKLTITCSIQTSKSLFLLKWCCPLHSGLLLLTTSSRLSSRVWCEWLRRGWCRNIGWGRWWKSRWCISGHFPRGRLRLDVWSRRRSNGRTHPLFLLRYVTWAWTRWTRPSPPRIEHKMLITGGRWYMTTPIRVSACDNCFRLWYIRLWCCRVILLFHATDQTLNTSDLKLKNNKHAKHACKNFLVLKAWWLSYLDSIGHLT